MQDSGREEDSAPGAPGKKASIPAPVPMPEPNMAAALVAAESQVNRIVISRILERAGLSVVGVASKGAVSALSEHRPGIVVIDCENPGGEHDDLLAELAVRRQASAARAPRVVMLAAGTGNPPASGDTVDAVLSRPVTQDKLIPVIDRLLAAAPGR